MGILRTDKISGLETPTAVTGSVSFDGNDHLSIGNAGNFNFLHNGATDWTVEFWAKTGTATRQFAWGTGGSSAQTGFYIHIMSQADGQADATGIYAAVGRGASGNYINWGANDCLTLNTWHHIAAVFKSSDKTLALYVDGREVDNDAGTVNGTFAAGNYSSSNSTYAFIVGKNLHGGGNYMNGEISNLRVVAGRRLYTSDFTPPVHALEPINGTRILCCNNPDSVAAVSNADIGTAHLVEVNGDPTVATDNPSLTRDFTSGTEFGGVTTFDTQGYFVPPSGTTEQRGAGRGIFSGGYTPTITNFLNTIEYIQISTQGNSKSFGDLISPVQIGEGGKASNHIRGLTGGGNGSPGLNQIEYITIATTGNGVDFGDLTQNRRSLGGAGSNTRAVFCGGTTGSMTDRIDYVTVASLGDAADFGNLLVARRNVASNASPTRGVFAGGNPGPSPYTDDTIDYITMATTGDAADFGNLSVAQREQAGGGNTTRGLIAGGYTTPAGLNTISYITVASLGNAVDFGDMTVGGSGRGGTSNTVNCVFGGGSVPAYTNTMDFVKIASTGNASDFGDLNYAPFLYSGQQNSDSHGGLS